MSNSNPWDIHSSLHRNPSTATGASMFSSDYYHPQRFNSRHSIGSTVGPPPVSPRSGEIGAGTDGAVSSPTAAGSPWPISSPPSSPGPAPPPAVQSGSSGTRTRQGARMNSVHGPSMSSSSFSSSSQALSPLNVPEPGSGRISPSSPGGNTPIQRPGSHLSHNSRVPSHSRASMEHEFTLKHAQLVDQAKLLLAEMQTLQVLGPIHGVVSTTARPSDDDGTTTHSNSNSNSNFHGDDASSFLSGSNTNPNNTAVCYEQDEASMAALSAILQGKLGSLVSKPPPRPARAVAREVVAKFGTATPAPGGDGPEDEEAEAEAIDLLMEDYETTLGWARSALSSSSAGQRPISSAAAISSSSSQGQNPAQAKIQRCLDERQVLLEAALPAYLGHLPSDALMHFGHERLFVPPSSGATSVHSGRTGNGNGYHTNGSTSLTANGNGITARERGGAPALPQQTYANTRTFVNGIPIEDVPRRRFLKTDDGHAWDMLELVSILENDLSSSSTRRGGGSGSGGGVPILRNPYTWALFTPEDVNRILAHPMGRSLGPYPASRRRSISPVSARPVSPVPLPETVATFAMNQNQERQPLPDGEGVSPSGGGFRVGSLSGSRGSGSYRPRLYGHDEEIEPDDDDDARRHLLGRDQTDDNDTTWSARSPPYAATTDAAAVPQSPASPPAIPAVVTTTGGPDIPQLHRPYSPPSSPPPRLVAATGNTTNTRSQLPRLLPGSYPTWEEREQDKDERLNPDVASSSRYGFLAAPSTGAPAPAPTLTSLPPNLGGNSDNRGGRGVGSPVTRQSTSLNSIPPNTIPSGAGLIQDIANGLASIAIPTSTATSPTTPSPAPTSFLHNTGGEYRSSLLGNLVDPPNSSSSPAISSPSSPAPLIPRPLSASTTPSWLGPTPLPPTTAIDSHVDDRNNNSQEIGGGGGRSTWESRERERGRWEGTNWANNDYLSSSYGVATPPPSGPVPVSSLNTVAAAAAAASGNSNSGHRVSGYFSLGASHRNISLEQSQQQIGQQQQQKQPTSVSPEEQGGGIQRGRWETREYANLNVSANINANVNPFASSRDPSANGGGERTNANDEEHEHEHGHGLILGVGAGEWARPRPVGRVVEVDVDAGPFELADTPPARRLPELGGSGAGTGAGTASVSRNLGRGRGRNGNNSDNDNHDDDDDAHSREWMGQLSSA